MTSFSCGQRELHEPHWAQYQRMSDFKSSTSRSSSPREHRVHDDARVVLLEVLGRRADRGAHAARQTRREGVPGDDVVVDPPGARLLGGRFVEGLPLGLVRLVQKSPDLAPVLLTFEGRVRQALDVRVVAALLSGLRDRRGGRSRRGRSASSERAESSSWPRPSRASDESGAVSAGAGASSTRASFAARPACPSPAEPDPDDTG